MTDAIGAELGRFADRHNLGRQLRAAQIVAAANQLADGRFVAQSFRSGALTVRVPTQVMRRLVEADHIKILAAINQTLGRHVVERLRFVVGGFDR